MTRASEGSQYCIAGKERKDATFAGCDICEICRPSAKRSPEKNCVAMRGADDGVVSCTLLSISLRRGAAIATRLGIVRAESMLSVARTRREAVVIGEG